MVNKVILIGNVGQDPELKETQNGFSYVRMSLATSEHWKDKMTGEKKSLTTWHNLKVYDRLTDLCMNYVKKGTKLYIEGSIRTSEYEKDGEMRKYTEVVVKNITLLSPRDEYQDRTGIMPPQAKGSNEPWDNNDSIPF